MANRLVDRAPVSPGVLADPVATIEAYVSWLMRTGLSPNTKTTYATQVRAFAAWLTTQPEHIPVDVFTDPHCRDYAIRDYKRHLLGDCKRRPKGVDVVISALANLCVWLGVGKPEVSYVAGRTKTAPKALDTARIRAVLRSAERRSGRDLALVTLLLGAGLRVSEVARLDEDDVWISGGRGEVEVRLAKGDTCRTVPLNRQSREAMAKWLPERRQLLARFSSQEPALFVSWDAQRMSPRSIRFVVNAIGDAAGLGNSLSPHILRHTFATVLTRAGVDLVVVSELMGHASVDTTAIYTRPTKDEAAASVEKMDVEF